MWYRWIQIARYFPAHCIWIGRLAARLLILVRHSQRQARRWRYTSDDIRIIE